MVFLMIDNGENYSSGCCFFRKLVLLYVSAGYKEFHVRFGNFGRLRVYVLCNYVAVVCK
jgi:hypothetical protein